MILEALSHEHSCFVTLTYNDESLPDGGTLVPSDAQKFLKRLRKAIHPHKIRYYLVGEYGDRTFRPHYHLCLYGLSVEHTQIIADAWSLSGAPIGHVVVGSLTFESAAYVAGYVTKKMTSADDPRLGGRHPEFARMSLNPGIGARAMDSVAELLYTKHGSRELAELGDVPGVLRHGDKSFPLGRYLKRKLREKMGIPEFGNKHPALLEQKEELSVLFADKKATTPLHKSCILATAHQAKTRSIEVKYSIFSKGKSL